MRKLALLALLAGGTLLTAAAALSAKPGKIPGAGGTVWAVERFDGNQNTLAAFDAATGDVQGVVPIGKRPIGVIGPRGTEKIYTADERSNQLSVVSKDSLTVVKTIPMLAFPHHMHASRDGGRLYVGQYGTNTVGVVDTQTDTRIADWPASANPGARTHAVWITKDAKELYATNEVANSVSKLDARTGTLVWELPIGNRPSEVLVRRDTAYVTVRNEDKVKIVDVSGESPHIVGEVAIGTQPDTMRLTNSGKTLVVGLRSIPQMALLDTETLAVQRVTFPGYGISGHQWLSANGKYTYIALESTVTTQPGAIGVVDNESGEILDLWTYPGGPWPHGVYHEPQVLR